MVEQLYTAGRFHNILNIRNFIKLLGKEVEDLVKDFIKYITELYMRPDSNIEINKNDFI